jgi:hypothetical protein
MAKTLDARQTVNRPIAFGFFSWQEESFPAVQGDFPRIRTEINCSGGGELNSTCQV